MTKHSMYKYNCHWNGNERDHDNNKIHNMKTRSELHRYTNSSISLKFMGNMKRIHQEKMNELKITYLEKIKNIRINRKKMYIKDMKEKMDTLETYGYNYITICNIIMNIAYCKQYVDYIKQNNRNIVSQNAPKITESNYLNATLGHNEKWKAFRAF